MNDIRKINEEPFFSSRKCRMSSNGAVLHRENFPVISRADQVLSIREDSSGSSSSHETKRGIHEEVEKRVGLWNRE